MISGHQGLRGEGGVDCKGDILRAYGDFVISSPQCDMILHLVSVGSSYCQPIAGDLISSMLERTFNF